MRRAFLLLCSFLLLSGPAMAGEKKEAAGQYVDMSPVALPVIINGRVKNYVFVNIRLHLMPAADPLTWRDKEPYFRDALVRAAHRSPFSVPTDWAKLDEVKLKRTMLTEAVRITGPNVIASVEITHMAPQRRTVTPAS